MISFVNRPGATPIDDISGLKISLHTQEELNIAEANNIAKATLKYLAKRPPKRTAPFSGNWIQKLHKEMFGDVWEWAGELRTSDIPNHGFVAPYQIPEELRKLIDDLAYWETSDMPFEEQAVRLHHRAVWIHPFKNGNGRWSRMLADIWLRQHEIFFPIWPIELGQESSPVRNEYIDAVRAGDEGYFVPLMELQFRYTAQN